MSAPDQLKIDAADGKVAWRSAGEYVGLNAPGAFDARYDPGSERLLVLIRNGTQTCVNIFSPRGDELSTIEPPNGYSVSHFADASGLTIICQGEEQDGSWWDWQFLVDPVRGEMRRSGPAY